MTKLCIKIQMKSDSAIESAFPWMPVLIGEDIIHRHHVDPVTVRKSEVQDLLIHQYETDGIFIRHLSVFSSHGCVLGHGFASFFALTLIIRFFLHFCEVRSCHSPSPRVQWGTKSLTGSEVSSLKAGMISSQGLGASSD